LLGVEGAFAEGAFRSRRGVDDAQVEVGDQAQDAPAGVARGNVDNLLVKSKLWRLTSGSDAEVPFSGEGSDLSLAGESREQCCFPWARAPRDSGWDSSF